MKLSNKLKDQTSPYLLQHAANPVDWYPWCSEAFEKAKKEDKPVFLSIGYSTCHWCHVMAHESFENESVARVLNENFVAVKVDKEERPDLDNVYMAVCQTFTGSGGWPMSVFLTPDQRPFFAGTYFPRQSAYGQMGFTELLQVIHEAWKTDRQKLLQSADTIIDHLKGSEEEAGNVDFTLPLRAISLFRQTFDGEHGGFGNAPKFPTPHNLLFLLWYYELHGEADALTMAEKTMIQMYKGGLFDHIGFGFSRYSTDRRFLVPHFEKMLYDNALLMMSYTKAALATKEPLYRRVAEKTADYVLRQMRDENGGFYCAQDADSEGVEGKYYVFDWDEPVTVLGVEQGEAFNRYYDITKQGNFEGKNIPNLLMHQSLEESDKPDQSILLKMRQYRQERMKLHMDDKQLTSWNSLMIAAFAMMYQAFGDELYVKTAQEAVDFIENNLRKEDGSLAVSWRKGKRTGTGYLEDYAFYVFALLSLYEATLEQNYLDRAMDTCGKALQYFWDQDNGGCYLYGKESEKLILRPKDSYDGAIPSGNSVMAYNLVKLSRYMKDPQLAETAEKQLSFLSAAAKEYPAGYCFFLCALMEAEFPGVEIVCVKKKGEEIPEELRRLVRPGIYITVEEEGSGQRPMINDKTTYYVCREHSCQPPVNELPHV